MALPLFQSERNPQGEANVYMAFGDMYLAQDEGWARRAERYLAEMRRRMEEAGGK